MPADGLDDGLDVTVTSVGVGTGGTVSEGGEEDRTSGDGAADVVAGGRPEDKLGEEGTTCTVADVAARWAA